MKIEWLVTNVTALGSPASAREESDIFWVIIDIFWPIQVAIVAREHLCDLKIPSCGTQTLLRIIY